MIKGPNDCGVWRDVIIGLGDIPLVLPNNVERHDKAKHCYQEYKHKWLDVPNNDEHNVNKWCDFSKKPQEVKTFHCDYHQEKGFCDSILNNIFLGEALDEDSKVKDED